MPDVCTHLMFDGCAEAAMQRYIALVPNSGVLECEYYGEGDMQGKIQQARFSLAGRDFICIDTPIKHDFTFTPAMSIFIDCDSLAELETLVLALSEGGKLLMPQDCYGFSTMFAWLVDRFGVSWQINLPA